MEYVHAALLLHSAGQKITDESITKVLKAAGTKVDDAKVKSLVAALAEVNIEEAIKTAPAFTAATAAPAAVTPTTAAPKVKEEKKEEKKEEEDLGLASLFG
jgi:large subunit ribosomal protein L12